MAGPTLRAATSGSALSGGANPVVTIPTVVAGDTILVAVGTKSIRSTDGVNAPAGWATAASVVNSDGPGSYNVIIQAFNKVASGDETTQTFVRINDAAQFCWTAITVQATNGVIDGPSTVTADDATSFNLPSLILPQTNELLIQLAMNGVTSGSPQVSFTNPIAYGTMNEYKLGLAAETVSSSGATGTRFVNTDIAGYLAGTMMAFQSGIPSPPSPVGKFALSGISNGVQGFGATATGGFSVRGGVTTTETMMWNGSGALTLSDVPQASVSGAFVGDGLIVFIGEAAPGRFFGIGTGVLAVSGSSYANQGWPAVAEGALTIGGDAVIVDAMTFGAVGGLTVSGVAQTSVAGDFVGDGTVLVVGESAPTQYSAVGTGVVGVSGVSTEVQGFPVEATGGLTVDGVGLVTVASAAVYFDSSGSIGMVGSTEFFVGYVCVPIGSLSLSAVGVFGVSASPESSGSLALLGRATLRAKTSYSLESVGSLTMSGEFAPFVSVALAVGGRVAIGGFAATAGFAAFTMFMSGGVTVRGNAGMSSFGSFTIIGYGGFRLYGANGPQSRDTFEPSGRVGVSDDQGGRAFVQFGLPSPFLARQVLNFPITQAVFLGMLRITSALYLQLTSIPMSAWSIKQFNPYRREAVLVVNGVTVAVQVPQPTQTDTQPVVGEQLWPSPDEQGSPIFNFMGSLAIQAPRAVTRLASGGMLVSVGRLHVLAAFSINSPVGRRLHEIPASNWGGGHYDPVRRRYLLELGGRHVEVLAPR